MHIDVVTASCSNCERVAKEFSRKADMIFENENETDTERDNCCRKWRSKKKGKRTQCKIYEPCLQIQMSYSPYFLYHAVKYKLLLIMRCEIYHQFLVQ